MSTSSKPKILFLCTGDSCRSQMAEGFCTALFGDRVDAFSAGTQPGMLNPLAVRAMAEAGIDISGHFSKNLTELGAVSFDVVLTVCDSATKSCPLYPGRTRMFHKSFPDPPHLAQNAANEEEAMVCYRRVRDEVGAFLKGFIPREFPC